MQTAPIMLGVCSVLMCGCAATPSTSKSQAAKAITSTPLILERDEGERRVVRGWPGHPDPGETFILKIDPKNGGSQHLVSLLRTWRQAGRSNNIDIPILTKFYFCKTELHGCIWETQ
jgi:hypothetical protein